MKKFAIGFGSGFLCSFIIVTTYVVHLLVIAQPGFKMATASKQFTREQKVEVVAALIKLSEISNFTGFDRYAALFGGSAGMLGAEVGMSPMETRHALNRALALTKKYGDQTQDFNPYLEASFNSALLYKDQGNNEDAKRLVVDAIDFAQKNASDSYWIENLKRLQKIL